MKISSISKKALFLLFSVLLGSNTVFTMSYVQKFKAYLNPKLKQVEDSSRPIVDKMVNSPIWTRMCNYLIQLGKDVDSCVEYKKGEVATPLPISSYKKLDSDTRATLIFLTLLQLSSHILPSPKYEKITPKKVPNKEKSFGITNKSPNQASDCKPLNQTDTPQSPQSVSFSTHQGNNISCDLHPDLSLNCCTSDNKYCAQFNVLDNQGNVLHNCCFADAQGKITCSELLCSDPNAIKAPCVEGGDLYNKTIDQTYSQKHHELKDTLIKTFGNSDILKLRIPTDDKDFETFLKFDPIKPIVNYGRQLEKQFNITPEYSIKHLKRSSTYDYFRAELRNADKKATLVLAKHHKLPQLDFVLAHELTHIQQFQKLKLNTDQFGELRPGFEISADILGSLAADYKSIAAAGIQWLRSDDNGPIPSWFENINGDLHEVCSSKISHTLQHADITRDNAPKVSNLLQTHNMLEPHPAVRNRAIILLKLSTMIKSAVQYLESKTS